MKKVTLLAAACFMMVSAASAHAAPFPGPLTFQIWNGTAADGVTDQAALPVSDLPFFPTAFLTYEGPIAFVNDGASGSSDTFGDFFGANKSGITSFFGFGLTEDEFLALPMSTSGADAINSFIEITGSYTAATAEPLTVYHADGASLYSGIGNANTVFTSPAPTTGIVASTGSLPAATELEPFALAYVDANGAPAVLSLTNPASVPEPSSLALLGSGVLLLGFAGLAFARRSNCRKTLQSRI